MFQHSQLQTCEQPFAANQALYLSILLSTLGLTLNAHLHLTIFIPDGTITSFQVWFACNDLISSYIASSKFYLSDDSMAASQVSSSSSKPSNSIKLAKAR
jgi:hypothetical protein